MCLIDFSEASVQVLQWAILEARTRNMHISILYPYRLDQLKRRGNVVQSKLAIEHEALAKFDALAAQLLGDQQVTFDFRTEVGFIRDRIQEYTRKNNVSLLVMARSMAIGNAESLEELVDEIRVPLVIVPSRSE